MLSKLYKIICDAYARNIRRKLKGRTCAHEVVYYHRVEGKWSHPRPHPHSLFADRLKVRERETETFVTCQICGTHIHRQIVKDYMPADGNGDA